MSSDNQKPDRFGIVRRRFPKGHRVVCIMSGEPERKEWLKRNKTSFSCDDEKVFVEAFVAGDTLERGISIISLDNPDWCLYRENRPIDKNEILQLSYGYLNKWAIVPDIGRQQVCPYKS